MRVGELEGARLDYWVARAVGWRIVGEDDYTKPEHRPSKDYPGTIIDDWGNKGPHKRLVPPDWINDEPIYYCGCDKGRYRVPEYSSDWQQGGPLIQKYVIDLESNEKDDWLASIYGSGNDYAPLGRGETPLIAACRCIVASVYGDEVPDD